jgi:hypothetical protein
MGARKAALPQSLDARKYPADIEGSGDRPATLCVEGPLYTADFRPLAGLSCLSIQRLSALATKPSGLAAMLAVILSGLMTDKL